MKEHETIVRVQYFDTDAMGIVHHSNYIRYFETARTEFLREVGYTYERMEAEGLKIPVLGVSVDYKTPAVYDELIKIKCWIKKLGGASFEVEYEVSSVEDGTVHATGWSRHGFTDDNLKPVALKRKFPEVYSVFIEKMM